MFWWVFKVALVSNFVRISWQKSWSGARAGHRNIRDGPYHTCTCHTGTCHTGKTHGNEVASGGVGFYVKLDSFLIVGWRSLPSWRLGGYVSILDVLMLFGVQICKHTLKMLNLSTTMESEKPRPISFLSIAILVYLCWIFPGVMLWMQPLPPTVR